MLKRDPSKLETMTDVCLFVGYPKDTKGYMFYDPQDQKAFVSTNAKFLEEDYMIDNKPKSKVILEEMREKDSSDPVPTRPTRVASTQDRGEPHRSGRVIIQYDRFIGLGELPIELETDPYNYNEAVQDKDATLWQRAMNAEIESMYSNQVWTLVNPTVRVKPI